MPTSVSRTNDATSEVSNGLQNLSLQQGLDTAPPNRSARHAEIADSWEDDEDDEDEGAAADARPSEEAIASNQEHAKRMPPVQETARPAREDSSPVRKATEQKRTTSPPPQLFSPDGSPIQTTYSPTRRDDGRRPEKTNSAAARMIAGALGMRAPRRTEEQKAYETSLREREKRAREDRRRAEEERVKARESVWGD